MRLTPVGSDVWVGDFNACNAHVPDFPLSIHIWSPLNQTEGRVCRVVAEKQDVGIYVQYVENQPLASMSVPIEGVLRYAAQRGPLLVHCAGSAVRSPTLAILALIARGMRPWGAWEAVVLALLKGSGVPFAPAPGPLAEIYGVCGLRPPWDSPPTTAGAWPA